MLGKFLERLEKLRKILLLKRKISLFDFWMMNYMYYREQFK